MADSFSDAAGDGTNDGTNDVGGPSGGCFNCGDEGHNKVDCPNPRQFHCSQEGHMAKDCPARESIVCRNCGQMDEAWAELESAIAERDLDDVKEALAKYSKACPEMTYVEFQQALIDKEMSLYLIAMERPLAATHTNMDLQAGWPANREELLDRLQDAGDIVETGIPRCSKCKEMGHVRKHCQVEHVEEPGNRLEIKCYNCDGVGHRMRDCPIPRASKMTCRNCGLEGHKAAELGHFARDCPQRSGNKRSCYKCGSLEHLARACEAQPQAEAQPIEELEEFGSNMDAEEDGGDCILASPGLPLCSAAES
ncbi:unnamed protein product [Parascedosporium putredinis]|uniref:CCHC-type domain-containing protein n=1 Tax=Parascedosporium putredinis TaxID=1442378 RepID=A0A9P1H3C3_9PEZI|nr:unnamed protein product [Parascedosporium putredinis]CAI7995672.1 unnamed protein product [Parascedosporium putredinis]